MLTYQSTKRSLLQVPILLLASVFVTAAVSGAKQYSATGLVLKVDALNRTIVLSCESIPGYMDAMVMSLSVRDATALKGITSGMVVTFTLRVDEGASYAENIQVRKFDSTAQDPEQARRLKLLQDLASLPQVAPLEVGDQVPDFSLIDQKHRKVALSQFAGKVVAINFVYTRCPLPEYCFRLSNNFGRLQKRFATTLGRELVLLTVTFDPVHDQPDILANYARTWKADGEAWRFLTGSAGDVEAVCARFGVAAWQDEATLTHTLHTAIIGRDGKLAANLEGNQFSAEQLGDLVETVMSRPK